MRSDSSDDSPSPRAFAQASGVVLQLVGVVLALGTCCWWTFAGLGAPAEPVDASAVPRTFAEQWRAADASRLWGMFAVCVSLVGGLALAALGLGLQAEKRRSGTAATWVSTVGALFWFVYFAYALTHGAGVGRLAWCVLMFVAWGLCAVLSIISADELKRHPPPPDLGRAPADLKPDRLIDREMPKDLRD
jgi:hypothetical protein